MKIPEHVGIICDGNRRFAKALNEVQIWKGHEYGAEKIDDVIDWCDEIGVKTLTLWLFSTENFNRSEEEKQELFRIAKETIRRFINNPRTHEKQIKLDVIGDLTLFPHDVQEELRKALAVTKDYTGFLLNIAVGYGGKHEILTSVRKIAKLVLDGKLKPEEENRRQQ